MPWRVVDRRGIQSVLGFQKFSKNRLKREQTRMGLKTTVRHKALVGSSIED